MTGDSERTEEVRCVSSGEIPATTEQVYKSSPQRMAEYSAWIQAHYPDFKSAYGECREAAKAMQAEFPELTIVPGHVWCTWGKRDHVWLTTPWGEIVDPTKIQFTGVGNYEPWTPETPVRVGRCMNCGDDIYACVPSLDAKGFSKCICSDECDRSYRKWLTQKLD